MNDPCKLATTYAEKISKCKTIEELKIVGQEIKLNIDKVAGWDGWLRGWYMSHRYELLAKDIPFEDKLNVTGKRAWKKGILHATDPE